MAITKHATRFLAVGLNAFDAAAQVLTYTKYTTVIQSPDADTLDLSWMNQMPGMREWVGNRQHFTPSDGSFTVAKKDYENTIDVKNDDLLYGRSVTYDGIVAGMAGKAARKPHDLAVDLLKNGHGATCYDGQYFFDTDHPDGVGGTWSNIVTGTGTTLVQRINVLMKVYDTMRAIKVGQTDPDNPEPLNVVPDTIVCAPGDGWAWRILFNKDNGYVTTGTTEVKNPFAGEPIEIITEGGLTATSGTYFLYTGAPALKPLVMMECQPFKMEVDYKDAFDKAAFSIGGSRKMRLAYYAAYYAIKAKDS